MTETSTRQWLFKIMHFIPIKINLEKIYLFDEKTEEIVA